MELELLAAGYGLVEGPRTDADDNLYFTDIPGGTVNRRRPDGTIETLVSGRRMVGGLALHADGGFVMSGPTVAHWHDGDVRVLLEVDGVKSFNDIQPDAEGRVYAGAIRSDLDDLKGPKVPSECYRIGPDGQVDELYGGVEVSNGIGFSPDGRTLYHVDSTTKGIWVHDVAADGAVSNRRHIGREVFGGASPTACASTPTATCGSPTSAAAASSSCRRRATQLDEIPVPAKAVTSVAFGGPDVADMYIVTADHLDEPERRGCVFRCRPGVTGLRTPLVTV